MALINSIRIATRSLIRDPGVSLVAVLTLAVGIGMTVAVWSVIDAVLIDSLPYPESERMVQIGMTEPGRGETTGSPMSALDYLAYAHQNRSFAAMAATFRENLNLTGGSTPERVSGAWVSSQFFTVMGISPQLGRAFEDKDDAPGRDRVAIISHGLWQRRFDAASEVLGKSMVVNGHPHVIIGVAPQGFFFPTDTDLWLPIAIDPETEDRGHGWVVPIARLRTGEQMESARADLEDIAQRLQNEYPDTNRNRGVVVTPLKETIVGSATPSLMMLLAGVVCVLVIASANVTILMSVRTAARQREMAVRHALGARRGQLVSLALTESVVLALAGGAIGLVLANWGTKMMTLWFSGFIPSHVDPGLDAGLFWFAVILSLTVGLLAGLMPALRMKEDRIMAQLREADRNVAGGSSAIASAMVLAEIALSVVLLTGAVLLLRTFGNLIHADPGFESDRVLTAEVSLTDERYSEEVDRIDFYRQAIEEIQSIPGVDAAGTVYPLPLFGRRVTTKAIVEGTPAAGSDAERPLVELRFVSSGYREAVGLRLLAGRFVEDSDTTESPPVVVVNESFVRQLCPPGDAIGRRTTGDDTTDPEAEWQTIVGVVQNVRHIDLAAEAGPEMYIPVAQYGFDWATFVVRSQTVSATALANPVMDAIRRADPDLPVFNVQPMTSVVTGSLAGTRVVTSLLVLFASIGLALSGVGVFAVVSYSVGRRVHEVAVRISLGGTPTRVIGLFVRQGLVPVAAGLILGVATALVLTRVMTSRLFGVAAHDPLTFSGTVVLILTVAAIAAWVPAHRASRIEPMTVLRSD